MSAENGRADVGPAFWPTRLPLYRTPWRGGRGPEWARDNWRLDEWAAFAEESGVALLEFLAEAAGYWRQLAKHRNLAIESHGAAWLNALGLSWQTFSGEDRILRACRGSVIDEFSQLHAGKPIALGNLRCSSWFAALQRLCDSRVIGTLEKRIEALISIDGNWNPEEAARRFNPKDAASLEGLANFLLKVRAIRRGLGFRSATQLWLAAEEFGAGLHSEWAWAFRRPELEKERERADAEFGAMMMRRPITAERAAESAPIPSPPEPPEAEFVLDETEAEMLRVLARSNGIALTKPQIQARLKKLHKGLAISDGSLKSKLAKLKRLGLVGETDGGLRRSIITPTGLAWVAAHLSQELPED